MEHHHETLIGTITGIVLSVSAIKATDIESTMALASLGAGSGFVTTLFLKWIYKKIKSWI